MLKHFQCQAIGAFNILFYVEVDVLESSYMLKWMRINTYKAFNFKNMLSILTIIIICNLTYIYNKVLFHFLCESFTFIVGLLILIIAVNVSDASENGFFTFLAIGFGYVGLFNLLHVINYENINVIYKNSFDISLKLAALSTGVQAISTIISFKFIDIRVNCKKIIFLYTCGTVFIVLATYIVTYKWNIFRPLYVEGHGQALFDNYVNLFSALMFCFSIYLLYKHREKLDLDRDNYIILTFMIFAVLSKILFVMYIDINGRIVYLAHLFSVLSFYFLYKSVITSVLREPYKLLFKGLKDRTDRLEEMNNKLNIKNSQLKAVKDRHRRSKDRYKQLVKSLPDSVIIRYKEEIVFANDATMKLLEARHRDEIVGTSIFNILNHNYMEELEKNSTTMNEELRVLNLKAITLYNNAIDIEICEIETAFENRMCNLMVIRDISERKKFYELQIELNSNIEREKIRGEFFANLSHELRTPINVIYSALQLEDIYIKKNDINGIEKYNNVIKQNCHRLLRMCNNLIDITKIEKGLFNPFMKCCNIVYIVERIVPSVLCYAESSGIDIIFDTSVEESYVLCDSDMIERIILNLLSNSVKYGKKGGNIWIDIFDKDNEVSISVKDDGIGIREHDQNSIFGQFSQVDNSLKREREGSGLGLSIVKSLVEIHSGSILLKSQLHVGSEFIVTFPKSNCYNEVLPTTDVIEEK